MKKIISLLLALAIIMPTAVWAGSDTGGGTLIGSAVFGQDGISASGITVKNADSYLAAEQAGKSCWQLGMSKDENCFIYMDAENSGASQYENYRLDVKYLDSGLGHFRVRYRAYGGTTALTPIIFENSGEWKTASFYLMRLPLTSKMQASEGGCSFSVVSYDYEYEYSHAPVYISDVKLFDLGNEDLADVTFETAPADLSFIDGEEQSVSFRVKNNMLMKKLSGDATVSVIDDDGNVLSKTNVAISVNGNRSKVFTTGLNIQKYGVHTLKVEVRDEAANAYSFGTCETSLSVKNKLKKKNFGVSAHFSWTESSLASMRLYKNLGAGMLRDELLWKDYEKTKGEYKLLDHWNAYLDAAVSDGIEPLIILNYGNTLYTDTTDSWPLTNDQLEAYGNYVYNVVSDTKGRVKYFEVWNEPNLAGTDWGKSYAKMLKVAYTRAKEANPDAQIVGLVMAGASNAFMSSMESEDADIYNYMDIASFHEYAKGAAPENDTYTGILKTCNNSIRNHVGTGFDIWLTEMGYSENEIGISEDMAARYEVREMLWCDAENLNKKIFTYTWHDGSGAPAYREANFGMLNRDSSAKKTYVAYAALNKFTADGSCMGRTVDSNGNYIYKYANGKNKTTLACFNQGDKKSSVTVTPEFDSYDVYDMYGNCVKSGNGAVTLEVDGEPLYVVSSRNGAHMSYSDNTATICGEVEGASLGDKIMIYVLNPGKTKEDIMTPGALAYTDQLSLLAGGAYECSFGIHGDGGVYNIYIGYGGNSGLVGPVELEIRRDVSGNVGIYDGDTKIEELSAIVGDVTVRGYVTNNYNANVSANLYAAGYSAGKLVWTELLRKKAEIAGRNEISFGLDSAHFKDIDKVKTFLWTDDMTPICGADEIN